MPWLRIGDTSADHPVVLAVLESEGADDRLLNEVFGFVMRCAVQSTAHLTDYVVTRGTAIQMAGQSRADVLLKVAEQAGYLTPITTDDGKRAYKLVDDDNFMHMRTREEIEFERQRKQDNASPSLVIPVRLRDGDACRYCGLVVNFNGDRRSPKAGTYDHLTRDVQSPDDMVVACQSCNATLLDAPRETREKQMLPPPEKPYFKPKSREWLENHDFVLAQQLTVPGPPEQAVRAGTVPPGRVRGTAASHVAMTPPPGRRSAGLSDTQSERDPASTHTSYDTPARQHEGGRGKPTRSAGLSDTQSERDPASSTGKSKEGPPPRRPRDHLNHVSGSPPSANERTGADFAGSEAGRGNRSPTASDQAKRKPTRFKQVSSRFQAGSAGVEHSISRFAGSGRDGPGRVGTGRAGHGLDGPGQAGTGRASVPLVTPKSGLVVSRRRRR